MIKISKVLKKPVEQLFFSENWPISNWIL
jgi:hypothetical protein